MKKMTKILALLLSVLMIASALPFAVFAATPISKLEFAFNQCCIGKDVTKLSDIVTIKTSGIKSKAMSGSNIGSVYLNGGVYTGTFKEGVKYQSYLWFEAENPDSLPLSTVWNTDSVTVAGATVKSVDYFPDKHIRVEIEFTPKQPVSKLEFAFNQCCIGKDVTKLSDIVTIKTSGIKSKAMSGSNIGSVYLNGGVYTGTFKEGVKYQSYLWFEAENPDSLPLSTEWIKENISVTGATVKSVDYFSNDKHIRVEIEFTPCHAFGAWKIVKNATCTQAGSKERVCSVCGAKETAVVAKLGHTSVTDKAVKATMTKNGKTAGSHCSVCGAVITKQKTVYMIKTVKLSATKYTYNSKTKKPTVTVKDSKGKTLVKGTDYTVTYASGRKTPGKYSVKITFKGKYSGSKTLYFTIAPKQVTGVKVSSSAKKTAKVTFTKATGATGYQIYYSTKKTSSFKKLGSVTANSFTYKKLTSGKTYYFKVRAYKKTSSGTVIYGAFSSPVAKKIK